jgi:hypothetical protein
LLKEALIHPTDGTNPVLRKLVKRGARGYTVTDVSCRRIIDITTNAAAPFLHVPSPFVSYQDYYYWMRGTMKVRGEALTALPIVTEGSPLIPGSNKISL